MEELKNEKELKVKSFRVGEDTFEKFKKIAGDEFGNQGQCLEALINLYETETSKVAIVERKLEIESFQDYLNKINTLFLTSLQLNQDAEGRIRDEFARQLTLKDKIIQEMQDKNNELKESNQNITLVNKELQSKIKEVSNQNSILSKDKVTLEELVSKNDELLSKNKDEIASMVSLVNEYKEYKEININLVKQIEELKQQHQEDLNNIKSNELDLNSLNKQIKSLEDRITEFKLEIKEEKSNNDLLRKEHKKELIELEEKLESRFNKEIENTNKMYGEKLEIEKSNFNKEIESINKRHVEKLEIEKQSLMVNLKSAENDKVSLDLMYKQEIDNLKRQIKDLKKPKDK